MRCTLCDRLLSNALLQAACAGALLALYLHDGAATQAVGSPWLWAVGGPGSALAVHLGLVWRRQAGEA